VLDRDPAAVTALRAELIRRRDAADGRHLASSAADHRPAWADFARRTAELAALLAS
jgi:hypothetical protein